MLSLTGISGTVGVADRYRRLVESLPAAASLLIVDQSRAGIQLALAPEDRVEVIRDRGRGLSRARNIGLQHASGDILCFPDDNCWYSHRTVEKVLRFFEDRPDIEFASGMQRSASGAPSMIRWLPAASAITRRNVPRTINSSTLFVRARCFSVVGGFDEALGVGAVSPWLAGEENDLVYRLLSAGYSGYYCPDWVTIQEDWSTAELIDHDKLHRYNRGLLFAMRRNGIPLTHRWYWIARGLGQVFRGAARRSVPEMSRAMRVVVGRLEGSSGRLMCRDRQRSCVGPSDSIR